jgi:type III restriction enzyme
LACDTKNRGGFTDGKFEWINNIGSDVGARMRKCISHLAMLEHISADLNRGIPAGLWMSESSGIDSIFGMRSMPKPCSLDLRLELYARNADRPKVHPFMLIVAQHTAHASELRAKIEADDFFGGRYKGRVLEVHSALTGAESDEAAARLVALETDSSTEIVIHVNKLKEGWDVNNLYTIVPLRASAADILTEQTLGRGLRLPYGARTGNVDVDRLTVIAHDRFDELIRRAREPGSIVLQTVTIGEGGDVPRREEVIIEARPVFEQKLFGPGFGENEQAPFVFDKPEDRHIAEVTLSVVEEMSRKLPGGLTDLTKAEAQTAIKQRVERIIGPRQGVLEGALSPI